MVLAGLSAAFPGQAFETARFTAHNLLLMTPVILFAAVLTSYARASGADGLIARVFVGRAGRMILAAAAFGAITPLCGIGVLPIVAGLLAAGVPLSPIMAFWLSSPITDPAMLAVTAGTLGLDFAVAKSLAALLLGLLGGFATQALQGVGAFAAPLRDRWPTGTAPTTCGGAPTAVVWQVWRDPDRSAVLLANARSAVGLMVKWLTLAFALESLIVAAVPPDVIAGVVGADSALAVPVAVAIGTPLYVDGYAALPLVRGLIDLGMTSGAALGFLIAGGVTSAYASVAVFALVRWPVFLWYLVLAVIGSALAGYGFEVAAGIDDGPFPMF